MIGKTNQARNMTNSHQWNDKLNHIGFENIIPARDPKQCVCGRSKRITYCNVVDDDDDDVDGDGNVVDDGGGEDDNDGDDGDGDDDNDDDDDDDDDDEDDDKDGGDAADDDDDDDDENDDDDDGNDAGVVVVFVVVVVVVLVLVLVVVVVVDVDDDDDDDDDDGADVVVCTYFPRTRGLKWQQRTQHVPGTTVGTPMVMLPCELPPGNPLLSGGGGSSRLRWSIGDHHPNSETTNHLMWKSLIYYCEECHFA